MPIKPELRKFYGREWRTVTRPRILARAGNKCETCQAPNHTIIVRFAEFPGWWFDVHMGTATDPAGIEHPPLAPASEMPEPKFVICILTVAHLNHTSGDDRDENLKALCQRCHLEYDKQHHHESRATRKDARRPLLAAPQAP